MKRLALGLVLLLAGCANQPGQGHRQPLPPPPPAGEPAGMIGMSAAQLQGILGRASFTRRENGSEIWRYDVSSCRAFFFFYMQGRDMRVQHVETLPHPKSVAADLECLKALRGKPASPSS